MRVNYLSTEFTMWATVECRNMRFKTPVTVVADSRLDAAQKIGNYLIEEYSIKSYEPIKFEMHTVDRPNSKIKFERG